MKNLLSLWQHQKKAAERAIIARDFAFLFEMGTGKSGALIHTLRHKFNAEKRVMRTLILSPPITLQNWREEFSLHSRMLPHQLLVLDKSGKKRCQEFLFVTEKSSPNIVVITNYEAMQMEAFYKALQTWRPEILVCDESQRVKSHQSKRAKKVARLADECKHRYILTGTPILNSPMDIFMQYRILDGGETFGDNFYVFRAKYFQDANAAWAHKQNHFPKFEPREDLYPELHSKIYSKAMRVLKKDCLDLPPLVKKKIYVTLSKDQSRMYGEMKREYITYVEDLSRSKSAAVVAQLAIVRAIRLQQIVSGYVKTEDGKEIPFDKNPRLDALEEILEEITTHSKVIVWAVFRENYRQIAKMCKSNKWKYVEIHGGRSTKQKNEAMVNFREDRNIPIAICNQAACGVGVNLTEAPYSIYFSRNFKWGDDVQSEARNYRGGSEMHSKITRIDLIALGTIDELVSDALEQKQNISEQILDWKL